MLRIPEHLRALGADIVPIEQRLAVPISEEAVDALFDHWLDDPPLHVTTADVIAWDLNRIFGDDGLDLYSLAAATLGHPRERGAALAARWTQFARERLPSDRLLVDLMDDAEGERWPAPPEVRQALEALRNVADRNREALAAADDDEAKWQAAADAEHAAWLAEGAPSDEIASDLAFARGRFRTALSASIAAADAYVASHCEEPTPEQQAAIDAARQEVDEAREALAQMEKLVPASIVPFPAPPAAPAPDRIISSAEFVRDFVPPEYLVDGILQRRFFYSLTAQTGAGKTAVALLITALVATGKPLGEFAIEKGQVLYFAGENPTDVQMRWIGLSQEQHFDPAAVDVHWLTGAANLSEIAGEITQEVLRKTLSPSLVVVDTAAAYNFGDDENSNAQQVGYARLLRTLTDLPGGPCVIVLCHPTKGAGDDDLVPRGGGAFLAEVDGNIAVKRRESTVTLSPQRKFRGNESWHIACALKSVRHPRLKDAKGRDISTVVAEPITDAQTQQMAAVARRHEDLVLQSVDAQPTLSLRDRATMLGWRYASGKPDVAKVDRALKTLEKEKLIRKWRGVWELLAAGEKELNRLDLGARETVRNPMFPSVATVATDLPFVPPSKSAR